MKKGRKLLVKNQIFGLIIVCTHIIVGCGSDSSTFKRNSYKDKEGLISFSIPEGWILKNESNGMRFGRADNPKERSTIVVNPKPRDSSQTLKRRQEISNKQIQAQDGEIITDKTYSKNGFLIGESEFELRIVSAYSFDLFSDDFRVEVKLMASKEHYLKYISDIKSVVESIRAN